MKVLFSVNKNPKFITITEYIESALKKECEYLFFDDRSFIIPGRLRRKFALLHKWDVARVNRNLVSVAKKFKPDIFLASAFFRILPRTIKDIKNLGAKTVLWTVDPLRDRKMVEDLKDLALYYDFVFAGGSEAYEILKDSNIKNLHWLPFACDPEAHKEVSLTEKEKILYGADIVFVGSVHHKLYSFRTKVLEALSDFNLAIWGPGANAIAATSTLKPFIHGEETTSKIWTKIYSASKIVLCIHFRVPQNKVICYQASPRVYEALACKSFLLVDDQKDVNALFKDGRHLVIFKDIDDLRVKIKYYLEHPEERERIAEAGYNEVINKHTYHHRVKEMLNIIKREA